MAKVKAPLFSFGASGKLGDSIVFFPWKGMPVVRSYVEPANPNSAGQQTQRGYFSDAVDGWHDIGLDADDVAAWNRLAATAPSPRSGFNAFVGEHVDFQVGGDTPEMGFDGSLVDDADDTFTGQIEEGGTATAVDMVWGTSPTSLINTQAASEAANVWTASPSDNVAGQTLYARFIIKDGGGQIGSTGVYRLVMAP